MWSNGRFHHGNISCETPNTKVLVPFYQINHRHKYDLRESWNEKELGRNCSRGEVLLENFQWRENENFNKILCVSRHLYGNTILSLFLRIRFSKMKKFRPSVDSSLYNNVPPDFFYLPSVLLLFFYPFWSKCSPIDVNSKLGWSQTSWKSFRKWEESKSKEYIFYFPIWCTSHIKEGQVRMEPFSK